jgi:DNA-directed RNA polymerase subunit RPC12/RpoP
LTKIDIAPLYFVFKIGNMNYTVLSRAVILSPNAQGINYKYKCDNCGTIQGGGSSSSASTITGSFTCSKCGTHNNVLIKKM